MTNLIRLLILVTVVVAFGPAVFLPQKLVQFEKITPQGVAAFNENEIISLMAIDGKLSADQRKLLGMRLSEIHSQKDEETKKICEDCNQNVIRLGTELERVHNESRKKAQLVFWITLVGTLLALVLKLEKAKLERKTDKRRVEMLIVVSECLTGIIVMLITNPWM